MTIKAAFNGLAHSRQEWPAEHMKINMYNMFLHDQANKENEGTSYEDWVAFWVLQWG